METDYLRCIFYKRKYMGKGYGFLLQIIDKNEFLIEESRVLDIISRQRNQIRQYDFEEGVYRIK